MVEEEVFCRDWSYVIWRVVRVTTVLNLERKSQQHQGHVVDHLVIKAVAMLPTIVVSLVHLKIINAYI